MGLIWTLVPSAIMTSAFSRPRWALTSSQPSARVFDYSKESPLRSWSTCTSLRQAPLSLRDPARTSIKLPTRVIIMSRFAKINKLFVSQSFLDSTRHLTVCATWEHPTETDSSGVAEMEKAADRLTPSVLTFFYRCANFCFSKQFFNVFCIFLCNFCHFCKFLYHFEHFLHIFCVLIFHT